MIAPDSKSATGSPPSAGSWSTIAGIRLFGEILRNSSLNWSPKPIRQGTMR